MMPTLQVLTWGYLGYGVQMGSISTNLPTEVNLWDLAVAWPAARDLVFFPPTECQEGFLGTALEEISWSEFSKQYWPGRYGNESSVTGREQQASLWCGVLSYDQFSRSTEESAEKAPSRVFSITAGWRQKKLPAQGCSKQVASPAEAAMNASRQWCNGSYFGPEKLRRESAEEAAQLLNSLGPSRLGRKTAAESIGECQVQSQPSRYSFEELVQLAQADIRTGLYYQINLLRYFDLRIPSRPDWLLPRLRNFGGPHSFYLRCSDLEIASFSPERFVQVAADLQRGHRIKAQPIKGTAPRSNDALTDRAAARELLHSPKELAELHMIVDLLRNDLGSVAKSGTVQVRDSGSLRSYATVHHLMATIEAQLATGHVTIDEVLKGICPAGSITGTPKSTAVTAIRKYEERPRRYFMGNSFLMDDQGNFESNVLIRTLVREGGAPWSYAAGAGITIGSDPAAEARGDHAQGCCPHRYTVNVC